MTCTVCGKEHEKGATVTLMGKDFYYCSIHCAIRSEHSDPVIEAMIQFFNGAKNTEQQVQADSPAVPTA